MANNRNKGQARNYDLESGVMRFGRSKTYHKKAVYKFLKKKTPKKAALKKPAFVEKKIGGSKNGGTRMVRVNKLPSSADYPTTHKPAKSTSKNFFSGHIRRIRPSLKPGTVAIMLAGAHKGKRIIIIKHLSSGLLLVNGPFKVNGCPLRRVNQHFLLATTTAVDISGVKVPEKLNDDYFRRLKVNKKGAKKEGDIFMSKKEDYKVSDERKSVQFEMDKQLLATIKKHPEGNDLKKYLRQNFSLGKGQYPHNMEF